jgi:hypothetical protein
MDAEVEELVVRAFIVPDKRARYVSRLGLPKARQKFINSHFFHMRDLDARFAERIAPRDQNAVAIYAMLRERARPRRATSCPDLATSTAKYLTFETHWFGS